jgi:peroxiredoxin
MSELQEKLAELKSRIEGNLTPGYLKIIKNTIHTLERSGIRKQAVKVGDQLPEFELLNQAGKMVSSRELLAEKPLIVTFYRGFWCPYCNVDMAFLQTYMPRIEELGATLVAISPEKPEYSQRIIKRQKLTFDILYDVHNEVAASFGLRWIMPDELIDLYKNKFHYNLKQFHGVDDWTLPVPGRYLADREGIVRYAECTPDYTTRPDPDDLISVLEKL